MRLSAAVVAVLLSVVSPASAPAFRQIAIGDTIPNRRLPALDGAAQPLLGTARANLFVFVRTGQDHSADALRQLARLEDELRGKPVRLVAVVSGDEPADEVRALLRAAGARLPVLVDEGDALYGELGVAQHPAVGIADARGRLVAFQPFRKVNFLEAVRGRVQRALGEIDEAGLAAILDPPAAPTAVNRARPRLTLARKLLDAGAVEAAIASARAAVELDPSLPEAHALLAEALARGGACREADRAAGEARRLDPATTFAVACSSR